MTKPVGTLPNNRFRIEKVANGYFVYRRMVGGWKKVNEKPFDNEQQAAEAAHMIVFQHEQRKARKNRGRA